MTMVETVNRSLPAVWSDRSAGDRCGGPGYHRYRGFMEEPIIGVERGTTGISPARKALRETAMRSILPTVVARCFTARRVRQDWAIFRFHGKSTAERNLDARPCRFAWASKPRPAIPTNLRQWASGYRHRPGLDKTFATGWIPYANERVFPTGQIAGLDLQPVMSGLVAVEYLWTDNFSITAQFDYYSPPFHGTGTRVLDKGVTDRPSASAIASCRACSGSSMESRTWTSSPGAPPTSRCRPSSHLPDAFLIVSQKSVNGARRNLDIMYCHM